MNTKRILAIALALLLALPTFALAEGNSFTLKLSDPVLTITEGGATTTQDLTGLALQLGGVFDLEAQPSRALLSLVLLAKDDPAVSAMIGMNDRQLYALASGISSAIALPLDAIEEVLADQGASLGLESQAAALADASSLIEKLQFTEGPAEEVQFYNATGTCPRNSAHLTAADLKGAFADLPEDASLDISYFDDGQGNLRVEGSVNNVIDSTADGERSLGYVFVIEMADELNYEGGAWIGNAASEINCNFAGSESQEFPGKSQFALVADLADAGAQEGSALQVQLSAEPLQDEDGGVADALTASVFEGDQLVGQLSATTFTGEESEYYVLSIEDVASSGGLGIQYTGTIASTGDGVERAGELAMGFSDGGVSYQAALNIALNTSETTEGKFPDISAMPVLNLEDMTDEQMAALTEEGTELAFTAMGKLMAVPSIAALLASSVQSTEP